VKFTEIKDFLNGQAMARDVDDIRTTAIRYVREETVDPVKALGRYAGFGCLGSLLIGLGGILLLVGSLRGLAHVFHGSLSWIPYLLVTAVSCGVITLTIRTISSGPARRRLTKSTER
jgi:hypothetical protein